MEITGPGGQLQWAPKDRNGKVLRPEDGYIMMLTSDIALMKDKDYRRISEKFAKRKRELEDAFKHAWYKLTTQDMGPATRCVGEEVPPAQPWQDTLPTSSRSLPDFKAVRKDIVDVLRVKDHYYGGDFAQLAYSCASTFRATDHRGGCNGARIRYEPYSKRADAMGLLPALKVLERVYDKYEKKGLTWADLIVLAGQVAHEEAGGEKLPFCAGRADAKDAGDVILPQRDYSSPVIANRDNMKIMGLSHYEFVALQGRLRDPQIEGE